MNLDEEKLIALNRRGYDRIGPQFEASRPEPWPEMAHFKEFVLPGDRILDVGCGHGRLVELFKSSEIDYHGLDNSAQLIRSACRRHPSFRFDLGDARKLPYPDGWFDSVWLVAVLHHLPPLARQQAVSEARRVVRPGGKVVMTVWQPCSEWLKSARRLGGNGFLRKWAGVSWLYYHRFQLAELEHLVESSGLMILEKGWLRRGKRHNIFMVAYRAPIA